jgi:hypothetical protein
VDLSDRQRCQMISLFLYRMSCSPPDTDSMNPINRHCPNLTPLSLFHHATPRTVRPDRKSPARPGARPGRVVSRGAQDGPWRRARFNCGMLAVLASLVFRAIGGYAVAVAAVAGVAVHA